MQNHGSLNFVSITNLTITNITVNVDVEFQDVLHH